MPIRDPLLRSAGQPWRPVVLAWIALSALALPARGQQIGPDVPVTTGAPHQSQPQVAAFGNTLVAVWFRDVVYRFSGWGLSTDGGQTWQASGAFPVPHLDFGEPTVCVDHSGRAYAAMVYGASGWGLAIYRGRVEAVPFSWEGPLFAIEPVVSNASGRAFHAPRLACDPERGYLYLTFTRHEASPEGFQRTIQIVRSLDGGTSWSAPLVLSGPNCSGSATAVGPDGEVYVVWEDFASRQVVGRRSPDFGAGFGAPFVVGEIRDNLGTKPVGWLPRTDFAPATDYPSLAVDRSEGPHRGRLYATWTDYADGPVSAATRSVAEREQNGTPETATAVALGDDVTGNSPSLEFHGDYDTDYYRFEGEAGTTIQVTGVVWSVWPSQEEYGRQEVFEFDLLCGDDSGSLVAVVPDNRMPITDGGQPPTPVIYTLPRTGSYYLRHGGTLFFDIGYQLSLRELPPAPGQAAQDHRDVVLTWSSDGGANWSAKQRVSDAPARYDETFPSVAVDGLGRVHLAWYDRRDDPGCGDLANTYWRYSLDGGASFAPSRRLSTMGSSWRFQNAYYGIASNIGDRLGLAAGGGRVHVLWTDTRGGEADIYGARIADLPTGIAVPRFAAEAGEGRVRLSWMVAEAAGIAGFRVHRAEGASVAFEVLDELDQATRGAGEYRAEDPGVVAGRSYRYRLEVVREGGSEWEGPVTVSLPAAITRLAWRTAGPNPFAGSLRLELAVPRPGDAWVRVYDLASHEVATLHRGALTAGLHTIHWAGVDDQGRPVAAGVYLLRADLNGERTTTRVVRIR